MSERRKPTEKEDQYERFIRQFTKKRIISIYGLTVVADEIAAFQTELHPFKNESRIVFTLKNGAKLKSQFLLRKQTVKWMRILKKKFKSMNPTRDEYETGMIYEKTNRDG